MKTIILSLLCLIGLNCFSQETKCIGKSVKQTIFIVEKECGLEYEIEVMYGIKTLVAHRKRPPYATYFFKFNKSNICYQSKMVLPWEDAAAWSLILKQNYPETQSGWISKSERIKIRVEIPEERTYAVFIYTKY
jgi:hypothetical protein